MVTSTLYPDTVTIQWQEPGTPGNPGPPGPPTDFEIADISASNDPKTGTVKDSQSANAIIFKNVTYTPLFSGYENVPLKGGTIIINGLPEKILRFKPLLRRIEILS